MMDVIKKSYLYSRKEIERFEEEVLIVEGAHLRKVCLVILCVLHEVVNE